MEQNSSFAVPFKPSRIHKFFMWIDHLPGLYWFYYIGLIVFAGVLNHIVAWNEGQVPRGEINWYYALTALLLAYLLFFTDFLFRVIRDSLVEFLPTLGISEEKRNRFMYEFTHLPAKQTTIAFFIGVCLGLGIALSIFPTAIEMNNAFPELEIPVFTLSTGIGLIVIYTTIRTYLLTNKLYGILRTINIYDLDSLYAMSRVPAWMLVFFILMIYLLFSLNPTLMETTNLYLGFTVFTIILAFLIFWYPLRCANRLLVLEKRRLLKDINLQIETTFGLLNKKINQQELGKIEEIREAVQSLMIEKEFVGSLRTWPWKPGTFRGLMTLIFAPFILNLLVMLLSKFINF
jgi:hypothetical protein